MDSKVINKLIRSEVWPILRQHGFSVFDSRTAFAYKGQFINVLNFQSFDSRLADALGCTTFSFSVNLGVYVVGSPWEHRLKRDKNGRLRPPEYACSLRTRLEKRTTVDGFKRVDIFFIHPDGRTTAQCFQEVLDLFLDFAEPWFLRHNNLDWMLAQMRGGMISGDQYELSTASHRGSYNWNRLHAMLSLLSHRDNPSQASADVALEAINQTIGTLLDFSTIQCRRRDEESYALDIVNLWVQLGSYKPLPVFDGPGKDGSGGLDGASWSPANGRQGSSSSNESSGAELPSARKQLWPLLKAAGFSEFTDRLAHRISEHKVEVVEFLPVDLWERKKQSLPNGLFRVGIGVFWTLLSHDGIYRTNGKRESRPVVNECHISNWLDPGLAKFGEGRMVFDSLDAAATVLQREGYSWFANFGDASSALTLLARKDWELFWRYPMMRGYGATPSSKRLVFRALFEHMNGRSEESERLIRQAASAISVWYADRFKERMANWVAETGKRLKAF